MEWRFQVHRMIAPRYLEIGSVGTTFDLDVFEHTIEFAGGGQRSPYAGKYAQVRVLKQIGARKNDVADVLRPQGAELHVRANFSGRLRIPQRGVERHWPVVGHRVQRQFVNFELQWFCSGFAGSKLHHGTIRDDLVDNQCELLQAPSRSRFVAGAFSARGHEYAQTFDPDTSKTLRSVEKPPVTALDGELFDRGDRRSVSITVAAETHSFGNAPRRQIRPVERFQFDCAGELFLQRPDDGVSRERPTA